MIRYLYYIFIIFSTHVFSQNKTVQSSSGAVHYGVSAKLNVEYKSATGPNIKFSLAGGVGVNIDDINFFPSIHAGIIVFNTGVIGSSLKDLWGDLRSHLFYNLIGTIKLDERNYGYTERYVPLYHFSDFAANPLQNPYKTSVSYGAVWVYMPNKVKQRIGFFNINALGRGQLTYYNDGGPVLSIVGDKRDRYYTGGLLLSYHGNEKAKIDLVELSFHKFTGYSRHAFDVADRFQIDFLTYANTDELAFNHQRWKVNLTDMSTGMSLNASIYDYNRFDLQDFLHFTTNVPYHPDYYRKWQWAIGGRYEYIYTELPK